MQSCQWCPCLSYTKGHGGASTQPAATGLLQSHWLNRRANTEINPGSVGAAPQDFSEISGFQDCDYFLPPERQKSKKQSNNIKIFSFQVSSPSFPPSPIKAPPTINTFSLSRVQKLECSEIQRREKEFLVVHYITKRFAPRPKEGGTLSSIKFL